jgi:hypothetical protein
MYCQRPWGTCFAYPCFVNVFENNRMDFAILKQPVDCMWQIGRLAGLGHFQHRMLMEYRYSNTRERHSRQTQAALPGHDPSFGPSVLPFTSARTCEHASAVVQC